MKKKRRYTLSVQADEPGTVVVFEPLGNEYVLGAEDRVRIEIGHPSTWDSGDELEIVHQPGMILLWLPTTDYRAWNEAGEELRV
jgi:hypothetical protein